MNSKIPSPKNKSISSHNILLKIIFIFVPIVFVLIAAGHKYFFAPYTADSNIEEKILNDKDGLKDAGNSSIISEKDYKSKIEFTFFETLTKPEKYTSLYKEKKTEPASVLKKKEEKKTISLKSKEIEKSELPKTDKKPEFSIQMGSFRDKSRAETFISMLNKKGYQTSIESAEILNQGLWYRIFLKKGFANRKSALKLIEEIKRKDKISALLKRSNR